MAGRHQGAVVARVEGVDVTHDDIIKATARWLRNKRRHPIVLTDVRCNALDEQPDVIGWTNFGASTVIECKANRSDFARDAHKPHRMDPTRGMGLVRWYAAPPKVIARPDLPERWGLLEVSPRGFVTVIHVGTPFYDRKEYAERVMLVQALRRATEGWGRRMFGEAAPQTPDGDPHPKAAKLLRELRAENTALRARLRRAGL